MLKLFLILPFVCHPAAVLVGQNRVDDHYDKLKRIQQEVSRVQHELAENKKKESSVLFVLTNLDLDIDLTQSLIQRLKKEQKQKEREIRGLEQKLKSTEAELQRLLEIMAKRLVHFYKYGRIKDIELLLTARSLNQGLLWLEYEKRLTEHDKRNYLKIKEKKAQIAEDKKLLTEELKRKKALIAEKVAEEKKLKARKKERQTLLASIRRDTELFRQQLAEKKRAQAEISRLIASLERERLRKSQPLGAPDTAFDALQGRMMWPVQGRIVSRFGRFKHPELKTVTENIGIDIEAPAGTPVKVVASGRVTVITWQRGRGNIVIVKHYGGYYTVYTHLKEILVNEAQDVQMGEVIGTVGESGSLEGPRLHFEVYRGTEVLNPERWLAVRT